MTMLRFLRKLRKDELGATAIEYGLVAGLISLVIVTTITMVGSKLTSVFNYIGTTLQGSLN
jgi:pilus assembly protein Flp/PilA